MVASVIRNACLAAIAAHAVIVPAAAQDERLRVINTQTFKSVNEAPHVDRGRVVFSKYSQDGNSLDVIAIDPADGSAQTLVAGVRDARLVVANDRYLVYSAAGSTARPLIVADRNTGQRLASVRLRDPILWGHIVGERLIVIQVARSGYGETLASPALVYRLPALELERTTTVTGGHEIQLWNDKIVVLGQRLAVHDLDLNKLAATTFPARDLRYPRASCHAHSLRIHADFAIFGPNCGQIAVYELPALRLARVIPGFATFHSFDVIDGLLFVVGEDTTTQNGVRVFELATGREVARLNVEAQFLAARAGRLLSMQRGSFSSPVHFTVYEPDLAAIRSDTVRAARVMATCTKEPSAANRARDIYRAIDECEAAGIQSYLDVGPLSADLTAAVDNYAEWLAHSLSRFGDAIPILERLGRNPRRDTLLTLARRKADYLRKSDTPNPSTSSAAIPGVRRQALDFGSFSNLIAFAGDRAYVARFDCGKTGDPGVTLDVIDRETFSLIKRVVVTECDDNYQDSIDSIHLLPGYFVLGLQYRWDEVRPNIAVVDSKTLEVVARGTIEVQPVSLGEWQGRLLRCATAPGEPHTRLDPATARLVQATDDEAIACLNGDAIKGKATGFDPDTRTQGLPIVTTWNYKVFQSKSKESLTSYRFTAMADGPTDIRTSERQYAEILGIPQLDAVVLSYWLRRERCFSRFDIATQTETTLFRILPVDYVITATWHNYLFVGIGRNLLVYDLERRLVARYEKDLIREGLEPFCNSCNDRNGIRELRLDKDRLIVLTLDGANSRVIDLPVYVARFTGKDFFEVDAEK